MIHIYVKMRSVLIALVTLLALQSSQAQFTLSTVPPLTGDNGQDGIAFNLSTKADITIEEMSCGFYGTGTKTVELWYNPNPINGQPTISTANGWVMIGSGNLTPANTTNNPGFTLQDLPFNISLDVEANDTIGLFIFGDNVIYQTHTSSDPANFSDAFVTLYTGPNNGYGGTKTSMINHPRKFCGSVTYNLATEGVNNLGVIDFEPVPAFCAGSSQQVEVTIQNYGINQVTGFDVNWTLDGSPQTAVSSTATLDTIGGSGNSSTTISLGNVSFPTSAARDFKVWTSNPNGGSDTTNGNDTLEFTLRPSLSGTYTLGGSNPDFADFAELQQTLNQQGICGATTIDVRPGTYSESLVLEDISGLSATNTLTIDGGSASTTQLTGTNGATNAIIALIGVDHVTIRNLELDPTKSGTDNWGVHLSGGADSNTLEALDINMPISSTTDIIGVVASASFTLNTSSGNNANYLTIQDCEISGGEHAVFLEGNGTGNHSVGNRILNTSISNTDDEAVEMDDQSFVEIIGCSITGISDDEGIYITDVHSIIIRDNYISSDDDCIYLLDVNSVTGEAVTRSVIANNFLNSYGSVAAGVKISDCDSLFIVHNTIVSGDEGMDINDHNNRTFIANNIITSNDHGIDFWDANTLGYCDFNSIYRNNTGTLIEFGTADYDNIEDWFAGEGYGENSKMIDPDFVSGTDYHINSGSFALGGTNDFFDLVGVDYDGETRCDISPTIGADEVNITIPNPTASFSLPDSVYQNTPTKIINTYKTVFDEPVLIEWYIDGALVSEDTDLDYTFTAAGTYDITLKVINCSGFDSAYVSLDVVQPTSTPKSDFVASNLVVNVFEEVQLIDNSLHGPTDWNWSVSPSAGVTISGQGTPNPTVAFLSPGLYEVCLETSNSLGTGSQLCKTDYILVRDEMNMCGAVTLSNMSDGRISDDGGPFGNYSNNANCSFLIDPCATEVVLTFTEWDISGTTDILRVYDGSDNTGTLIGSYNSNSSLPGGANGLVANSGKMYLEWETSAGGNAAGFSAIWTSTPDPNVVGPTAGFNVPDTIFTGTRAFFENTSTGDNLTYRWDFAPPFGDGGDLGENSIDNYNRWNTAGTYDVELSAIGCASTDVLTRQVDVIDPTSAPIIGFMADQLKAPVLSTITLTDTSYQGPTAYKWKVSPANSAIFEGPDNQKVAEVTLYSPGQYTVTLIATNSVGTDSVVKTNYIEIFDYCTPAVISTSTDVGISRVVLEGLDNSSDIGTETYTSYLDQIPAEKLYIRGSYELTLERNTTVDPMSRKVWIDWNNDGDFNDTLELVAFEQAAQTTSYTVNFTVPDFATPGVSLMRIGTSYSNANNSPCGINPTGEFEDYALALAIDDQAPVITLNGPDTVFVEKGYAYNEQFAAAVDNVDGSLTAQIQLNSTVDSSTVGTYEVRYNVSDNEGNAAEEVVRTVIVTPDVTAPEITIIGSDVVDHQVLTPYNDSDAVAFDYLNVPLANVISNSNVDENMIGTYSVSYFVQDAAGNIDTARRIVNVVDRIAPVISAVDTVLLDVFDAFDPLIASGITTTDNYYSMVNLTIASNNVNTNEVGTYQVRFEAEDGSNNTSTFVMTVIVGDNEAPVLSLIGSDTLVLDVNSTYFEQGATYTDNYCANGQVTVTGTPDMEELGEYQVEYDFTDCEGNAAATITRVIRVVDREAPSIELIGLPNQTVVRWDAYTDSGVVISDNYYDEADLTLNTTSNLNVDWTGSYSICYQVEDPSGNTSVKVCRNVMVVENTTEIQDMDNSDLTAYPNPNGGKFVVKSKQPLSAGTVITVTDVLGKVVYQETLRTAATSRQLELTDVQPGVYMVQIGSGNTRQTLKVNIVR